MHNRWSSAYPTALNHLRPIQRQAALSILRLLSDLPGLNAIVLGGSSTLAPPRPDADVDLWVFVDDAAAGAHTLLAGANHLDGLMHLYDGGHIPWFGHLFTFLFLPDCSFGVDVGLTTNAGARDINTGPGAIVLWSNGKANTSLAEALVPRVFRKSVERRVESVLMNLIKLNKSVSRGEYWGAAEYILRSRREVLGIIRDRKSGISEWYERPDREIASLLTNRHDPGGSPWTMEETTWCAGQRG